MSDLSLTARNGARSASINFDYITLILVASILLLGLIMVTSSSMSIASKNGDHAFLFLQRQLSTVLLGIFFASLIFNLRTELLDKFAMPLLGFAVFLLVLVLIPGVGHKVNGSQRWLQFLGLNIQVSEIVRVLALIFIASYSVRREAELRSSLMGLLKPLLMLTICFFLLLLEPDLGAAIVLMITGFGVLFIAGARLRDVIGLAGIFSSLVILAIVLEPYRMKRLTTFLNPWADPFNSGFQLTQSLIAIGRGGWTGVGLGESVQKLFYLPEAHTDFLFAVLSEELGLFGILLTIGLFIALAGRALYIAKLTADSGLKFQSYLAVGFGIWIALQSLINIGVNMGALPTKGLTLPLMSYGRSSLLVTLAWIGLLLRVYHEAVYAMRGPAAAALRSGAARTGGIEKSEAVQS